MTKWQNEPFEIKVKADDKLAFCMCGRSANGPYCDGSHKGSDILPEIVTFGRDQTIHICGCGRSHTRPYCDGSHKTDTVPA
ncbi:MAG: CDGSH iron-sulfur domain-containing protein [Alphaproteobacteria bacterium]|nr:CDGSH iron-sulfur domain-containing protein [Alphaproteobacteria bacterium]